MSEGLPSIDEVIAKASGAIFGAPLVTNVFRGQLIEAIIALAIEPEWDWCSSDYSSWDFERSDGMRLEVKQSSARQTWDPPAHGNIRTSFDIKARTGRWEGAQFIEEKGRAAHVYIFAYHPILGNSADHRCPAQWTFYVVATVLLPGTQRISLSQVEKLTRPVEFAGLRAEVASVTSTI